MSLDRHGHRISPTTPASADRDRLIDTMISASTDVERQIKRLSTWELDFLESVADQWQRKRALSPKQVEILERLYTEKIS